MINFNKVDIDNKIINNLKRSIKGHISGAGPFAKKCESIIEKQLNVKKALLVTSCTHALEASAILIDIKPGDEVIVPSYTFVSTALAFKMRGAKIKFADVKKDTFNIDEKSIVSLINDKTKAICVVHYSGLAANMDEIMKIANKKKIFVIEDNAHGYGAVYKKKKLGSIGHMATLSFHATKNFTCGEGGALLINDKKLIKRAKIIVEKGTNRTSFLNYEIKKYEWIDEGSSYVISDILASVLYSQLKNSKKIINRRKKIWNYYYKKLSDDFITQKVVKNCIQGYHIFCILFSKKKKADNFIKFLRENGITAKKHYTDLSSSPFSKKIMKTKNVCKNSIMLSENLVRLPLYNSLELKDLNYIVKVVKKFKNYSEKNLYSL